MKYLYVLFLTIFSTQTFAMNIQYSPGMRLEPYSGSVTYWAYRENSTLEKMGQFFSPNGVVTATTSYPVTVPTFGFSVVKDGAIVHVCNNSGQDIRWLAEQNSRLQKIEGSPVIHIGDEGDCRITIKPLDE